MVWKEFVKDKRKVKELAVTVLVLAIVLFFLPGFLKFVETRPGVVLPDPILNLFDPIDLTWLTFILIYGSLILSLYKFSFNPSQL